MVHDASVRHVDNTATHMGLIDDRAILEKYDQSVPNFELLLARHPHETSRLPVARVGRWLAKAPWACRPLRVLARKVTLTRLLPMRARQIGLQLYKAAIYAPVAERAHTKRGHPAT